MQELKAPGVYSALVLTEEQQAVFHPLKDLTSVQQTSVHLSWTEQIAKIVTAV